MHLDNLEEYIVNLEGEIERLEKENKELEEGKANMQDHIQLLESLLDNISIDYNRKY